MSQPSPAGVFKLKGLLAALPLMAVLPLILLGLWFLAQLWESERDATRRGLVQAADTLAVAVDREIYGLTRELRLLGELQLSQRGEFEGIDQAILRLVERREGWDDIDILAPDGSVLVDAALPSRSGLPSHDDQHVRAAVATAKPTLSDVYRSSDGALGVSIAVPVLRQDVVRWVLDGRLDTTRFTRVITSGLQESTAALVLDREMLIVARTPDLERHFDTLLAGDLRRALLESPLQGAIRVPADGGGSVIAAWKRVPVGWAVVVSEPTAIRDEPLRQSIARMAFAGSAVLGLGILMSLVVGQRVAQAVHAVGADAHTLAQGGRVEHRSSPILEIASMYEALEAASESLHQTALAREEATRALQEADRRKDEFLAMLAHELRNPLAPLRNAISLLGRSVSPDTAPGQAVAMCERQLRHMTRLVNDLLDVSRITQGKIELRRERMLLGDAVQDAIDSLQAAIEGQHQQLRVHLPAEPVPIDADRVRLTQVVENLLSNASKYTDAKGWIDVRVELDGPDVLIHVCDNGIGIAPEKLSHVFDLFAQIDTAMDRAQGGLGIGLSLVRSLVELHGGTVIVTSGGLGKGACFVVRLPQFAPALAA